MLVKFISFVITIFGTKRYQPVVFASVALIVSAIGISTVLSVYNVPSSTVASTVDKAEDPRTETISAQTPATKAPHADTQAVQDQGTQPTVADPTTQQPSTTQTTKDTAATAIQTTQDGSISLKVGDTSGIATFTSNDASALTWSIASEPQTGLAISDQHADKSTPSNKYSFSVKANTAGTYTLTVKAKDSTRGVDVSKNITVIVTAN